METPVALTDARFETAIDLAQGDNPIVVRATDTAGNIAEATVHVVGFSLPDVEITDPQPLAYLAATTVDVSGTVSPVDATVIVNGVAAEVEGGTHDLGHFVSIEPGTVSEDGSLIVSNPGVGLVKAGWHCGGNPTSSGTAHDCPECQKCPPNGSHCVADNSLTCDDHDACTAGDDCDGGRCVNVPIRILSVDALADGKKQTTVPIEQPVTFTATAMAEHCTPDIKWTFPDGSSMIGDSVTKAFQTPGFFTSRRRRSAEPAQPPRPTRSR